MDKSHPRLRPCPAPHCVGSLVRDGRGEWTCTLGSERHVPAELRFPGGIQQATAELEILELIS